MTHIWRFIKAYRLFSIVLLGTSVALGLDIARLDTAAHWLLIIASALALIPLLVDMVRNLREGKYGVDILAATAIVTALVMHEYWAAIVIVLMLTGGEALEDYAERRARRELDALLKNAPTTAHILRGRKVIDIKAHAIAVGDKLVIRPGELVPADAVLLEGKANFDEASLTGESLPQFKKVNDTLLSGSINTDAPVIARALQTAENSQYEQIIKLVRTAQADQAPFVRLADRYAIPFTLLAFTIAITAWVVTGESIRFLEVLVVATPCPLILAAPIAIISGMSRASKHGIIIKTGGGLERLAAARTFAFDKTGTLTQGELTVDSIKTFSGHTTSEVLGMAAALEQHSNHVLAAAIMRKAKKSAVKITKAKHVHEVTGSGLRAQIGGKEVLVGRFNLLEESGVSLPTGFTARDYQKTAAFVAIGGKVAGVISFRDEIRKESKDTLKTLAAAGVQHFMMITGDNKATARAIAHKLGITDVHAEALPGDKIIAIEKAAVRPIAFVGDGVNDAPVLTASDVGIALGARGSSAASESADVVIMQNNLAHVADARLIASTTIRIAKQSIFLGIGLSIILMGIFATGRFKPVQGAIIQEVVDVVVIVNALRVHKTRLRKP